LGPLKVSALGGNMPTPHGKRQEVRSRL